MSHTPNTGATGPDSPSVPTSPTGHTAATSPAPARPTDAAAKIPTSPAAHVYVDSIEGVLARLLIVDGAGEWQPFHMPLSVLPSGLKENSWIALHAQPTSPPPAAADTPSLRARLGADDDGGDFSL